MQWSSGNYTDSLLKTVTGGSCQPHPRVKASLRTDSSWSSDLMTSSQFLVLHNIHSLISCCECDCIDSAWHVAEHSLPQHSGTHWAAGGIDIKRLCNVSSWTYTWISLRHTIHGGDPSGSYVALFIVHSPPPSSGWMTWMDLGGEADNSRDVVCHGDSECNSEGMSGVAGKVAVGFRKTDFWQW